MVVWHHSLIQIAGMQQLIHVRDFGPSGVDLFFVISGFIMFVTTTEKPLTPGAFFSLRLVRVMPMYWLMTLVMIVCAVMAPTAFRTLVMSPAAVAKSLLFIPYNSLSFPGEPWPVLVPGWTLNYEMFFYAIFALCLFVPPRWRFASLVAALGALVAAGRMIGSSSNPFVWVYTSPLLLEFIAGCMIGYLWSRRSTPASLAVSVTGMAAGGYLLFIRGAPPLLGYSQMVGAALIVVCCLHPRLCTMKSSVFMTLGDASYSIYLTHLFTLGALRMLWPHLAVQVTMRSTAAFLVMAVPLSAAAGVLAYRALEKPLTIWLRESIMSRDARPRPVGTAG
jgi:exopolysaccharide production protein ExoZ